MDLRVAETPYSSKPRRKRLGVIGSFVWDIIHGRDPRETPVLAAGKKKAYLERYKRPEAEQGWHFLTGDQASTLTGGFAARGTRDGLSS